MERKQTRCADDKDIYPGFSNLTEGFLIARAINFRQIVIAIIFAHVDELSTIATGVNIFKDMMITWGDLDALICTSDEMACGCMMACHSAGIKVPNTVAIASLGGGVLSTVCSPALTTVEFPWHDIGVKAGKALLELLNDKPGEKFIEIPSVLKVRASTAA